MRTRAASWTAAICAAVALWLTRGALAVIGPGVDSPRAGVLPPLWQLGLLIAAAIAVPLVQRLSIAVLFPLVSTVLVVLPWLPVPVPAAFALWTGPGALTVWAAALVTLIVRRPGLRQRIASLRFWRDPGLAMAAAMAIAFVCYATAAVRLAPLLPGGDEPHYLVITQSLLADGDLRIENNHSRRDYLSYYPHELKPDYLRRGVDGQIYSIHAPGLSALIAPAFAAGGYRGVALFLALLSAAATALCWRLGWLLTRNPGAAWFGWAGAALSAPFFFHAFTAYPDGTAAAIVLLAMTALAGVRPDEAARGQPPALRVAFGWVALGAALAMLPWLHTRYVLLALVLGGFLIWTILRSNGQRWRVLAFLAVPVASAAAWFAFFKIVYGELSPAAPYGGYTQSAASFVAVGLPGLLFDQQFGLLANAPIFALALPGLWRWTRAGRRGIDLLLVAAMVAAAVPYLLMASAYRMWWGGFSAPARFAVPVVLLAAAPLAMFWDRCTTFASRFGAALLLGASLGITVTLTFGDEGRLLYNFRDGYGLWLEWFSPLANLSGALPSSFRGSLTVTMARVLVWIAAAVLAWVLLRRIERAWPAARPALAGIGLLVAACAAMLACTLAWRIGGDPGLRPAAAQLALLEGFDLAARPLSVAYRPFRAGDARRLPERLEIPSFEPVRGAAPGVSYFQPRLPAGHYRVVLRGRPPEKIDVRVGRGPTPVASLVPANIGARTQLVDLFLPIDVSSFSLSAAGGFDVPPVLRPVNFERALQSHRRARARTGARYGPLTVFALDEGTHLEPGGMWVLAGVDAGLALQPVDRTRAIGMSIRNGPTPNTIAVSAGTRRESLMLREGETRVLTLDVNAGQPLVFLKVRAEKGFRPKDVERGTTDDRLLGCWLEFD
jgi:hypothetical protein